MSKKTRKQKISKNDVILNIILEQQKTHREWIATLQQVAQIVYTAIDRADARERKNENERFKFQNPHKCESVEVESKLLTPTLVSKSRASTEYKGKKGSGPR